MGMDLDSLRAFIEVARLGSFTQAGAQLGVGKARVSLKLKALERELSTQLLQRTTRVVRLTPEGQQLLPRAKRLLEDADELQGLYQQARGIRGRVRIDLPVTIARTLLLPRLPELVARHPELELVVSTTDRRVDPVREGFDCVLRVGPLGDSDLVVRKLGELRMMNCASADYLRKHGTPQRLEDLDQHWVVHYSSTLGAEPPSFEYPHANGHRQWPMRAQLTVNSADAYQAACVAGLGIIQAPRVGLITALAAGRCVEILPALTCASLPVSLLHTHGRNVPRRVRAVMQWLIDELKAPELQLSRAAGS